MSIFAHLQKMQIIDKIMCKIVKTNQSYNNISMRSRLSQKNSHSESNHRQSGSDQFLLLIANKKIEGCIATSLYCVQDYFDLNFDFAFYKPPLHSMRV